MASRHPYIQHQGTVAATFIPSPSSSPSSLPCRDSKLTRILGEALGGVCKTSIIATLSPCQRSWDESVSTLRYASSAMAALNIEQLPKTRRLEIQVGRPRLVRCGTAPRRWQYALGSAAHS
jgi:hypothetical protein